VPNTRLSFIPIYHSRICWRGSLSKRITSSRARCCSFLISQTTLNFRTGCETSRWRSRSIRIWRSGCIPNSQLRPYVCFSMILVTRNSIIFKRNPNLQRFSCITCWTTITRRSHSKIPPASISSNLNNFKDAWRRWLSNRSIQLWLVRGYWLRRWTSWESRAGKRFIYCSAWLRFSRGTKRPTG